MSTPELSDLQAFTTIVRHGNFTRAAIEMGVTPSALSHRIRRLENQLEVRLLNRTTRSVTPTQAGQDLAWELDQGFATINSALNTLDFYRRYPAGRLRLHILQDAAALLLPSLIAKFVHQYPQINLEIMADDQSVDLVAGGFDAGIGYADKLPSDVIVLPVTAPLSKIVVASPDLLERLGRPQSPEQLSDYPCLQLSGADNCPQAWDLGNDEQRLRVNVQGSVIVNQSHHLLNMVRAGAGLAQCLEPLVATDLEEGKLEVVLPDWATTGTPLALFYPSRRPLPTGLRHLMDILLGTLKANPSTATPP